MASHTTSGEWQSFEARMRRRRAERLAVRAEVAVAAGYLDEAQACIKEGRDLAPSLPAFARVEDRLRETTATSALMRKLLFRFTFRRQRLWTRQTRLSTKTLATAAASLLIIAIAVAAIGQGGPHPLAPTREFRSVTTLVNGGRPAPFRPQAEAFPQKAGIFPQRAESFRPKPEAARAGSAVKRPSQGPETDSISQWVREIALETSAAATPTAERIATMTPALSVVDAPAAVPASAAHATVVGDPPPALLVRTTLDRYAAAYSALDARAAQRVWPRVNRGALTRAFETLASQQVSLGDCRVDVAGVTARASCAGSTTWTPKIGAGSSRTDPRRWDFELAKSGGTWQIVNARVQNR